MPGEQLLALVNPRGRKRASAKQVAWRKKFGKMYGGGAKRKRNPIAGLAAANPRRAKRRRNPIAGLAAANPRRGKRHHNPRLNIIKTVQSSVMPALTSAGATLAVDLALGYLPMPANMKTGSVRNITRAVGLVALGVAAGLVVKPETVRAITSGGLSIIFYDTLKVTAQKMMPNLPFGANMDEMSGLGYWGSGWNPGADNQYNMSAYLNTGEPVPALGAYMAPYESAPSMMAEYEDDLY